MRNFDGNAIAALFLAYFYTVAPEALKAGKIFRFLTPIVVIYKGEEIYKFIFTFDELKEFEEEIKKKPIRNLIYDYKKGLGSLSEEEWEEMFKRYKFEDLLLQLNLKDATDNETLEKWMNEDTDYRKEMISENLSLFDINQV